MKVLLDQQKEVQEALGESYDVPDVDESELMDELDALKFDMAEEQEAVDIGKVPSYLSTLNEPALPTLPPPMFTGPNQAPPETQQQNQQALDAYGLPSCASGKLDILNTLICIMTLFNRMKKSVV
eukprot:g70.t1